MSDISQRLLMDFKQALAKPGCAICRFAILAVDRTLDALFYENVNDVDLRDRLRKAHGFCNFHASQLGLRAQQEDRVKQGNPLGIAIIYDDVLKNIHRAEADAGFGRGSMFSGLRRAASGGLGDQLRPTAPCPACQARSQEAELWVDFLAKYATDPQLAEAYQASTGICIPHFVLTMERVRQEATFMLLRDVQAAADAKLQAELAEFIRKNDHRFYHEGMGTEADSWQRATARVNGEPGGI